MDNKNDALGGFASFLDMIPGAHTTDTSEDTSMFESITDEELDEIKGNTQQDIDTKDDKKDENDTTKGSSAEDDTDKIDEDVATTVEDTNVGTDDQYDDSTIITGFFDSLSEKLGWSDVTEDEKPKTAEDLIQYFADVIEEESKPEFANEEISKLNEFVLNGGKLADYFKTTADLDLDNIDLDDENNQKLIVRNFMKEKGYSSAQIDKRISRMEDAGILEDEARDNIDSLKEIKKATQEKLLEDQRKIQAEQIEAQRKFYGTVVEAINKLDNIRGIKVPEKDLPKLKDYIFKPESDGTSKWAKASRENYVNNLIEAAYFSMAGDTLVKRAKDKGNNDAVNRFKQTLNSTTIASKNTRKQRQDDAPVWLSAARQLRKA